uniref:dTDP-4-dehydrorhamnose 3,5-epimerase n=1 Tax=uncultured Sphingobacteriales bacterium HF0130_33B19 TaxID=710991 RepID=E0XTQ6_9SPHI|nr:dtdP-4-dehydrorhamnose 3,5-epimerase and related enzymes [uncultured Sphingobacteriales bacterium HF0130_33B19]
MEIIRLSIEGLLIIKPKVFGDERGHFFESWNKKAYQDIGLDLDFTQDNQSISQKGVLRGLHFQNPPYAQGKLVRVIKGAVIDVAVDLRKGSLTYGQHISVKLTEQNMKTFWIPPGFAHGFVALENDTIFSYKCTEVYNQDAEGSLLWNDPDLNISWGVQNPLVSEKDKHSCLFKNFKSPFSL